MKVTNVSGNTAFGRLILNVDKKILKSAPIKKEYESIKKIFKDNGFSKKKNVDVILNYSPEDKAFFGIIKSKKQGIPNNPHYKHKISSDSEIVKKFKEWIETWDYMYSSKGLKKLEEITKLTIEAAKNNLKNNKKIKTN